jgi:hypothetical protein
MAYLRLPDDSYFQIPEGSSPEQAYKLALDKYPDAFKPKAPKDTGFTGAAKSSFEQLKADFERLKGKTGVKDVEEAEKAAQQYEEKSKDIYQPTEKGWGEAPLLKFRELLGGSVPYMAAPIAVGGAAALGGAPVAVGTGLAGLASLGQFTGSNISRQVGTGKQLKDTDLLAAGAAAVPQAALDIISLRMVPGIGKIFGAAGKEITPEMAKKVAEQGILKTTGAYAIQSGKVAGIEGTTEAAQQLLERLQAGLNITDPQARDEYFDSFIGGVALGGTLAIPGTAIRRSQIKAKGQEFKRIEQEKLAAEQAAAEAEQKRLAEEEAFRKTQAETGQLFGEMPPEASALPGAPSTLTVAEREAAAATQQQDQLSKRAQLLKQADTFDVQRAAIEKQRDAAAEAGNYKKFRELDTQAKALDQSLTEIQTQLKELPQELTPEMEMAKLRGEQKKLIKQLQGLTGPSYDAKKADAITARLDELEAQISEVSPAASQMDLFDEAQIGAEQRAAVQQQKEQRAQEQEDFFAQTKGREVLDEDLMKQYQEGLQDLEDAYAAGASERIINQIIEKINGLKLSAEQSEEKVAKTERLKRAIEEQKILYNESKTDEEKATALANIGALEKRLATATVETSETPETVKARATTQQRTAHDSLFDIVDAARNNEEISPNAANIITSSYASGVVDELNAVRQTANQEQLTDSEALQVGIQLKKIIDRAIANKDPSILFKENEATPTIFENRVSAIKDKYLQGKQLKTQVTKPFFDAKQRDTAQMLRDALGGKERDAVDAAQKKVDAAQAKVNDVKEQAKKRKEKGLVLAPYYLNEANANLRDAKKELKDAKDALAAFEPDQKRIAELKNAVGADKVKDIETELKKAKQEEIDMERYAPSGISPDQKQLFGEKELEPVATVRATPANFMKFVNIQKQKFETAKKIAEDAIKKPMQKVKILFGEKYAAEFKELENVRLQIENENKKLAPELYTPSEADTKRYSKAFITARIEKAKNIREKHFANIKNLEDRQKEILEKLRGTEITEPVETLASKVAAQRQFVFEVIKADELAGNLRENATQLWQARGKIVKAIKEAKADKLPKKVAQYTEALKKLDAQAPQIKEAIDSLHARANELLNANLKAEKAILKGLEKKLADSQKGTPASIKYKQEAEKARADIAKLEGNQEKNLERQAKQKRELEEKQAAALKALPTTRQEIVETTAVLPGGKEAIKQKRIIKREAPKTAEEKNLEVVAKAKEGAAERVADKKAIVERLEKGLSGDLATAKSNITFFEKRLQTIEAQSTKDQKTLATLNTALNNAKTETGKQHWQEQINAVNKSVEAKQLGKTIDSLKSAIKTLKEKGVSIERGMTTIAAQPPRAERKKPLKVKKVNVTKQGEEAVLYVKKQTIDYEQEARDAGVSFDDYQFVQQGLAFGFKPRADGEVGAGVTRADVDKVLKDTNIPKGLDVIVLDTLPDTLKNLIEAQGVKSNLTKAGVMANGKVFIVVDRHKDIKDVKKSVAHELIGHIGVEGLLGEKGMADLVKKVSDQKGGVWDLAKKLGVLEDAEAAFLAAAKAGKNREESLAAAVKEMIAHTEEARFDKNLLQTAKAFIEALVGLVRSALRKVKLDLDISTGDIYKLLKDARRDFNAVAPGAYVNKDGDILFRNKADFNDKFEGLSGDIDKIVAKQKDWSDTVKAASNGLLFRTKYIDRFAPLEAIATKIKDSLQATQLMYFLRMHDQRLNWTAEIASNGPLNIVDKKRADGRVEKIIESKEGVSLKKIAEVLGNADVGNPEATNRLFTFYLAAMRAKRVGLEKLNFGKDVTPELLAKVMKQVDASPATKNAFEQARELYNDYNDGLINFAVKTGAISKDLGQQLLKTRDYVPFYRADPNGDINLEIGGAPVIRIGSLKDQPYLHELVGGDTAIMDFFTSALQNTNLLTDMALRNLATRNVAFSLNELGLLKPISDKIKTGIRKGQGAATPQTIRFKIDGEDHNAIVDTDTAGVPAELLVKGMEGVKTSMPDLVRMMGAPASLLRKFITRNPAYALRQVVRDSLAATMTSGSNAAPLLGAFKELGSMVRGKNEGEFLLQKRGILGGQVMTGSSEDMRQIMLQISSGKPGWNMALAKLDQLAIKGDAATRVTMYNSFIRQGLSEMEATLATLESMNFSKRGISPSVFLANQLIPFFNAQVQGLDVMYRAFTGKMPFSEKLKIKEKLIKRGLMMAGFTLAYAALMQDDEAYQNANEDEKYANWFVRIPGMEEPFKVPIPFELGLIFKAIPEAILNTAFGDAQLKDTGKAIGNMVWQSVPGSYPAAIKPLIEVYMNKSFFTGRPIESERLQQFEASERYNDRTTEVAKLLGKATGVVGLSPVKLEYLLRGYTGALPLGVVSLSNPVLRSGEAGEMPTTRPSELPLVGTLFQPKDASGLINKAYNEVDEVVKKKETYNKMIEEGRQEEADQFYDANADIIGMASLAGSFRQRMGVLTKQEREIRADNTLSGAEKRAELEKIKQDKIDLAKDLMQSRK